MRTDYWTILEDFFNHEVPGYVQEAGRTFIKVNITFWGNEITALKITQNDIANYYKTEARNTTSGMRSLAGHAGDWRNINNLAEECLAWFRYVDEKGMRRVCKKSGLKPKW